jgi:hypothetical protein
MYFILVFYDKHRRTLYLDKRILRPRRWSSMGKKNGLSMRSLTQSVLDEANGSNIG